MKRKNALEAAQEELNKYKDEPLKMQILNSSDYSLISGSKEFRELKKQENHFNMSVKEVTAKADALLLSASKHQAFSTKTDSTHKIRSKSLPIAKKKTKNYGTLFDEI